MPIPLLETVEPWLGWLILAVLLGVAELAVPGVFLIWIAMAAAATGLIAFALPLPLPLQVVLFALFCLLSVYAGRRWYRDNPVPSTDPLLNDRAARLIGRQVTVVEPLSGGEGRVHIDDTTWTATGPDADIGTRMIITGVSGATLMVERPAT